MVWNKTVFNQGPFYKIAQMLFKTHQDQSVSWDMDVLEKLALLVFASSEDLGLVYQA